jgi:hypothetical protein
MSKAKYEEMMCRFERKSRELLGFLYFDLDSLYAELSYNNNSLNAFMAGTLGEEYTKDEKKAALEEIRERIPAIYDEIKHVKECIQAEKYDMNRLRSKYGTHEIRFKPRRLNLDRAYRDNDWDENPILEQPLLLHYKRPPPLDGIYEDTYYEACTNDEKDDNQSDDGWNPFEFNDESYRDSYKFNPLLGTFEAK